MEEVVMGGTLMAGVTPEMRGSSPPAQALPAAERTGSGCRRPPWARHAGMLTASLQRPELRGECCCRSGPGLRCGYGSPAGWTLAAGASSLPGRRADRCRPGAMKGPAGAGPSGGTDVDPGPGGHAPRSSHLTNRYARGAGGREAEPRAERGVRGPDKPSGDAHRGVRPFPAFQPTQAGSRLSAAAATLPGTVRVRTAIKDQNAHRPG